MTSGTGQISVNHARPPLPATMWTARCATHVAEGAGGVAPPVTGVGAGGVVEGGVAGVVGVVATPPPGVVTVTHGLPSQSTVIVSSMTTRWLATVVVRLRVLRNADPRTAASAWQAPQSRTIRA